jgi:hypothetical protein
MVQVDQNISYGKYWLVLLGQNHIDLFKIYGQVYTKHMILTLLGASLTTAIMTGSKADAAIALTSSSSSCNAVMIGSNTSGIRIAVKSL